MTSIQRYDAWPQEWPFEDEHGDLVTYEDHRKIVEELEAKLAKALAGLKQCKEEIDDYIRQEYPQDHSLHERYRMRDFSANPARITLAALSKERSDEKGQDDAE